MKTERKFTWCVRYYDVKAGVINYRVFRALSVREINEEISDFTRSNKDCIVRVFKLYKAFDCGVIDDCTPESGDTLS